MEHHIRRIDVMASLSVTAVLLLTATAWGDDLRVQVKQNTAQLTPYQVFEITLQHNGNYESPLWDVVIDVALTSPSGKAIKVGGFFYGSSKPQKPVVRKTAIKTPGGTREKEVAVWPCEPADLWKARYAPSELGQWTYTWTLRNNKGGKALSPARDGVCQTCHVTIPRHKSRLMLVGETTVACDGCGRILFPA